MISSAAMAWLSAERWNRRLSAGRYPQAAQTAPGFASDDANTTIVVVSIENNGALLAKEGRLLAPPAIPVYTTAPSGQATVHR